MGKVLVLGANGFIGSHIVDALSSHGYPVRAFARTKPVPTPNHFKDSENVEFFGGDFFNQDDVREALNGIECVVHSISVTNPATAENDPYIDIELNVRTSVEFMQRCVDAKTVKRVIFLSSGGAVYGEDDLGRPFKEEDPARPFSPYAIGKLTIENYLRYFKRKHGIDFTVLRVANPYGPRQAFWKQQGVVSIFLKNILDGKPVTILGDGSMVRDYVYVTDVAEMVRSLIEGNPDHELYNVGSGVGMTIDDVVQVIESVTHRKAEVKYVSAPSTFVHTSMLDISRFNREFKLDATTDFAEGIRLTHASLSDS